MSHILGHGGGSSPGAALFPTLSFFSPDKSRLMQVHLPLSSDVPPIVSGTNDRDRAPIEKSKSWRSIPERGGSLSRVSRLFRRKRRSLTAHIAAGAPPPCARGADRSAIGANHARRFALASEIGNPRGIEA